jgi:sensor histidine kinase YesM
VPAFSVQTLVENAVKHGLEGLRDGGSVTIGCLREGDYVAIRVRDTGIGIPALFEEEGGEETGFFGIGLRNIGARLSALYDRIDLLELASRDGEGTTVTLRIPAEAHGAVNEASEKRRDGLDPAVSQ